MSPGGREDRVVKPVAVTAPLPDGYVEGCTRECTLHQSVFDLRTGQAIDEPYPVDVRTSPARVVDGTVEIGVE